MRAAGTVRPDGCGPGTWTQAAEDAKDAEWQRLTAQGYVLAGQRLMSEMGGRSWRQATFVRRLVATGKDDVVIVDGPPLVPSGQQHRRAAA
jgi:hypothetical protein